MALKTNSYIYPLINKFRDALAISFQAYMEDGLNINETVISETEDTMKVEFLIGEWKYSIPNAWCGVPFNHPMIDMMRSTRDTYVATYTVSESDNPNGTKRYVYTVTCRKQTEIEAPVFPRITKFDPIPKEPEPEIDPDMGVYPDGQGPDEVDPDMGVTPETDEGGETIPPTEGGDVVAPPTETVKSVRSRSKKTK